MPKPSSKPNRLHLGSLPARYSFVLSPHVRERFTRCPICNSPTRIRKLPLVVHVGHLEEPRLIVLNKSCRLCVVCETVVVHRVELDRVIIASGFSAPADGQDYVVLGTVDRRTWRRGIAGDVQLADIRQHMADFKRYLKVDVVPAHWERANAV